MTAPTTTPHPTFCDAYLVAGPDGYVGVVRRDRHIWWAARFGTALDDQPRTSFSTRALAGAHLLDFARQDMVRGKHHEQ